MNRFYKRFITKLRSANNFIFILAFILIYLVIFSLPGCVKSNNKNVPKNKIETYKASWWYLPTSSGKSGEWGRPIYGVINIDNSKLTLRHAILEGRELGDYRLPYWPITSFVSIFCETAELAHQSSVSLKKGDKKETLSFRCGDGEYRSSSMSSKRIEEGFELSHIKDADILKVTNKGSESPILMEHFFVINNSDNNIPVFIKATNTTDQPIEDVIVQVSYTQDFNWSSFGISDSRTYQFKEAPSNGTAQNFFAFSAGMKKGFEFHQIEGCELFFTLSREYNKWNVLIQNSSTMLKPGESIEFSYNLRLIDEPLKKTSKSMFFSKKELAKLEFAYIRATEVKTAPINPAERVTISDVIKDVERPKVRGLHQISCSPKGLDELAKLKDWGGNLAVTQFEDQVFTRQIIERGHKLGIEMFISGKSSFMTGIPTTFDKLFSIANLKATEYPDYYGQDEDHYYWYPVKSTLDFETEFGKPMSQATQEEKVSYWSRSFVDKWRKTLTTVRDHDPTGNIWFYIPAPSVAFIDPFDYYDQFFSEISQLGDNLTVFPFYYGSDYNQIEYMIHKWKDAGIKRAVFLPGGPTYSKPSQFLRAITAARRGGADGACGFAFSVDEKIFDEDWRWKSVMIASQANFPTPELNAFCFIEEPAELLEALAVSDISVFSGNSNIDDFIKKVEKLLPGQVQPIKSLPEKSPQNGQIYIVIGDDKIFEQSEWPYDEKQQHLGSNKGVIQMVGNIIRLNGSDNIGLNNAMALFLRFADLINAEVKR